MKTQNLDKKLIIGYRIKKLRDKIGITQQTLAHAAGLSEGTIISIETGESGYVIDSILAVCNFFGYEMEELLSSGFRLPDYSKLRERIVSYHKSRGSQEYGVLDKKPRAKKMLQEWVLPTKFLEKPRQIKEIRKFCKDKFKHSFLGPTLTNALSSLAKEGFITISNSDRTRVFLYQKRKM